MFMKSTDEHFRPSIVNAIVAPRPIGWISTVNALGGPNLAPFSYFNAISTSPPMVAFSVNGAADREEKDTLANVRVVPEFVANFASYALREAVNVTSATAAPGVSEFELAGLECAPGVTVGVPRVKAAAANLECRVVRIVDLPPSQPGERHSALVVGRVVAVHVQDVLLTEDDRFDTVEAAPIMRMGGATYARLGETFEMKRPGSN